MSVVYNPSFNPSSMYRPEIWLMQAVSANPVEVAIAEVYSDGVLIDTIKKSPIIAIAPNYYFRFDVQDVLQRINAPLSTRKTTIFGDTLGTTFNSTNTDCHSRFYIKVTYLYRDPTTNQLTDLGVIDTTSTFEAIIATRQHWETMSLAQYICVLASSAGEFLTNQPQPYNICTDENLFISFLPYLSNAFEIVTIDSAGNTIDTGVASLNASSSYIPQTLGVGLSQLSGVTWISGSVNTADPDIARYILTIGTWVGAFISNSVPHIFDIVRCCGDRAFRVHFLNRLGGADAYTFNNAKTVKETAKASIAQKPLSAGYTSADLHYIYNKGKFKYDSTGVRRYELETVIYDDETGAWLAELLQSPETYLETADGLLPIIIEDSEIEVSDTARLLTLKVAVQDANDVIVQRV